MTHDLTTAAGYQAWRDAGGRWDDETPERMRVYRATEARMLAEQVDLSEVGEEAA